MKIGTKKELITKLLTAQPDLRDEDYILMAEIWLIEVNSKCPIKHLSAMDFLRILSAGGLTSAESITRCRRKVQQEIPSLRGEYYKARHKEQIEVKQELKDWNNEIK
tara:strand:+ start:851 stop:1171 length:321 start_codon:yes stop_codon:yes gene_type:complete